MPGPGFQKGHSHGRKPRVTDFQAVTRWKSLTLGKAVADDIFKAKRQLPLLFLMEQMENQANDMDVRIECAKSMLPYLHPKISAPQPSEGDEGKTAFNLNILNVTRDRLQDFDDDDLREFQRLAKKLTITGSDPDGTGEAPDEQDTVVLSEQGETAT